MDNANTDGIDRGKKILEKVLIQRPLKIIERKFGNKLKDAVIIAATVALLIAGGAVFLLSIGADWKTWNSGDSSKQIVSTEPSPPNQKDELKKTPLQDVKGLNSFDRACRGDPLEVIQQLDDVSGKEKPFSADNNDPSIVSASESANSQVTKRYSFACKVPWELKLSFVPLKTQSVGVFVEYEDVFKILLGDGDRQTWKLEKNDLGRKSPWTEVLKEKLINGKISVNREVTLIILSKQKGNNLELNIKIRYMPEGKNDYIWEERIVNFEAKATDLVGIPTRPFRIGINDSRYKGSGSEIQFGIFSIREFK